MSRTEQVKSVFRDDSEMIGQRQSIAILSLNLIEHPYIVLER